MGTSSPTCTHFRGISDRWLLRHYPRSGIWQSLDLLLQRPKPPVQRQAISKILNSIIERWLLRYYRTSGGLVCYRGLV